MPTSISSSLFTFLTQILLKIKFQHRGSAVTTVQPPHQPRPNDPWNASMQQRCQVSPYPFIERIAHCSPSCASFTHVNGEATGRLCRRHPDEAVYACCCWGGATKLQSGGPGCYKKTLGEAILQLLEMKCGLSGRRRKFTSVERQRQESKSQILNDYSVPNMYVCETKFFRGRR